MKYKILRKMISIGIVIMIIILIITSLCIYREYKYNLESNNAYLDEQSEENYSNYNLETFDKEQDKVINILFLGIDKEEEVSDTIMILSLNKQNKTMKLVSIMRDTYVYQGEGMANKINYAYHYGGIKGSIDTVNLVFNLDISKYVKVDFEDLITIVDYFDGVEVNINEAERKYINSCCTENLISYSGNVNLNGNQALVFSRIRKIDSDFERTERQRKIMLGIFHKMKGIEAYKYPPIIYTLSKSSETNLSALELLELTNIVMKYDDSNLKELRIPIDGTTSDFTAGVYHLNWDEEVNKKALHEFIYG